MKKIIYLLFLCFVLVSCTGTEPQPSVAISDNSLSFKLNGVVKTYEGKPAFSVVYQNNKIVSIGIFGTGVNGSTTETISMSIISTPIVPINQVLGTYQPITVYSTRTKNTLTAWNNCSNSSSNRMTITIKENTPTTIKGTFSGVLCGGSQMNITEGVFNLKK